MRKLNFGVFVGFTGAAVNIGLFFVKLYIATSCNSLSIYLDSLNNAMDSLVCIVAAVGFILASKKKNEKYPFGFGRTEGVVSFLISVIILVTGASFAYSSLTRIMYPLPIWYTSKYALALIVTVPVKLMLLLFYKWAAKKQPSAVFGSLGLDSILDFFITLCSVTALTLSNRLGFTFDGIAGLAISIILIVQSIAFIKESLGPLIGRRDEELCQRISQSVSAVDGVKSVKDVQCHTYGKNTVANIVIETKDATVSKELIEKIKDKTRDENLYELFVDIWG